MLYHFYYLFYNLLLYFKTKLTLRNFLFAILMLVITTFCAHAQSLRYSVGMPYISLGAYSTKQIDPFSFTSNQAALAQVKTAGVGVFSERRFLLAENSAHALAAVIPTKKGNFGVQINYAGFANFNEQKAGLAYARSLGSKVDIGVQFNYYGYKIPAYNNASAINFELGTIVHVTDKINAGVHIYNPLSSKLGKGSEEKLAAAYKFGLGYDATDNFYFSTEIVKEENQPINVTSGVQYHFEKKFFARAGFRSDNSTGFAGIGFLYNSFRIDIATSFHPQLGVSPAILLVYNLKNNSK
jgi:hypothetical protein